MAYVIGSPIIHSKSPAIHRAAYRELGLDWGYQVAEVHEGGLSAFMTKLDPQATPLVSVTMPLKAEAAEFARDGSPLVKATGIANTLVFQDGRWVGENTDISGITRTLADRGLELTAHEPVTLLGSGATAISTLVALSKMGIKNVKIYARNGLAVEKMIDLGRVFSLSVAVLSTAELTSALGARLVISTWPTAATQQVVEFVPMNPGFLFDVTYEPWPSPLAIKWLAQGGAVVGGLDLLVNQAVGQIEMATNKAAPVKAMRAAIGLSQ